jgi:hypothetical protein
MRLEPNPNPAHLDTWEPALRGHARGWTVWRQMPLEFCSSLPWITAICPGFMIQKEL